MLRAGLGRLMAKGRLTGWTEGVGGSLTKAEGQDRGVVGGDLRGSTTQGWVFFFLITTVKDVYYFSQSIARQKTKDNYSCKP